MSMLSQDTSRRLVERLSTNVPFKPETWPVDADGFEPNLCTECGRPLRYGSRHSTCGHLVLARQAANRS